MFNIEPLLYLRNVRKSNSLILDLDQLFESDEIFTTQRINELINTFLTCFSLDFEYVIVALIYLQRITSKNVDLTLTYTNIKYLLYISLTLAAKFHDDKFEKQTIFSAISGLSRKHFRQIFDLFLDLIDFDLKVDEEEYYSLYTKIKHLVQQKFAMLG